MQPIFPALNRAAANSLAYPVDEDGRLDDPDSRDCDTQGSIRLATVAQNNTIPGEPEPEPETETDEEDNGNTGGGTETKEEDEEDDCRLVAGQLRCDPQNEEQPVTPGPGGPGVIPEPNCPRGMDNCNTSPPANFLTETPGRYNEPRPSAGVFVLGACAVETGVG